MAQVLRVVPVNRLALACHVLLNPGDRSEVDPSDVAVGGREVGGIEVEVDPDRATRLIDGMWNAEVEEEIIRSEGKAEVPS